jgi:hypothetical protein
MGGTIITARETDFLRMNEALIRQIYATGRRPGCRGEGPGFLPGQHFLSSVSVPEMPGGD